MPSYFSSRPQRLLYIPIFAAAMASSQVFAAFKSINVNVEHDTHDIDPGNGDCFDQNFQCSLRAAIEEANALSALDPTINISINLQDSKTYLLTEKADFASMLVLTGKYNIGTSGETSGTLPGTQNAIITKSPSIKGRVLHIANGADIGLARMTITNGWADSPDGGGVCGGGIQIFPTAKLNGYRLNVRDNRALNGYGGGICNLGTLDLLYSNISNNLSTDTSVGSGQEFVGGGLYNVGYAEVYSSSIMENEAVSGGGVYTRTDSTVFNGKSGRLVLRSVTVAKNKSADQGSAIFSNYGEVSISNSTISDNTTEAVRGNAFAVQISKSDAFFDESYQPNFVSGSQDFQSMFITCHNTRPTNPQNYSYRSLSSKIYNTMRRFTPTCDAECAQDIAYYLTQQIGEGDSSAPFYNAPEFSMWGSIIMQNWLAEPSSNFNFAYNCGLDSGGMFSSKSGYNTWGELQGGCRSAIPNTDNELSFIEEDPANMKFYYLELYPGMAGVFDVLWPEWNNAWGLFEYDTDVVTALPWKQNLFPKVVPGYCGEMDCDFNGYGEYFSLFDGGFKQIGSPPYNPGVLQLD